MENFPDYRTVHVFFLKGGRMGTFYCSSGPGRNRAVTFTFPRNSLSEKVRSGIVSHGSSCGKMYRENVAGISCSPVPPAVLIFMQKEFLWYSPTCRDYPLEESGEGMV